MFLKDWNLDDPPATDPGDLSEYRRVRDECKAKVESLLGALAGGANGAKQVGDGLSLARNALVCCSPSWFYMFYLCV